MQYRTSFSITITDHASSWLIWLFVVFPFCSPSLFLSAVTQLSSSQRRTESPVVLWSSSTVFLTSLQGHCFSIRTSLNTSSYLSWQMVSKRHSLPACIISPSFRRSKTSSTFFFVFLKNLLLGLLFLEPLPSSDCCRFLVVLSWSVVVVSLILFSCSSFDVCPAYSSSSLPFLQDPHFLQRYKTLLWSLVSKSSLFTPRFIPRHSSLVHFFFDLHWDHERNVSVRVLSNQRSYPFFHIFFLVQVSSKKGGQQEPPAYPCMFSIFFASFRIFLDSHIFHLLWCHIRSSSCCWSRHIIIAAINVLLP